MFNKHREELLGLDQFLDRTSAVYYCIPWHSLSIMSFVSGISAGAVNFAEIAVIFKYLSPKVGFLYPRHNNQAMISTAPLVILTG